MLSPSIWPGGVSGTGRSVVGGRHLVSVNFWVPHLLEALYPPSTLELEVVVRTCCGSVGKPSAPTSRALTSPPWPCHSGSLTSHRPTPQSRAGGLCLRQEELTDGNRACLGTEAGACRPQPRLPGGLCRAGSANRSSALCGWAALAGGGVGAVGALRGALAAVEGWALPGVPAYRAGMALL